MSRGIEKSDPVSAAGAAAARSLRGRRLRREGIFRPTYVRRLLDEHRSGRHDHHKLFWPLLMFQLWHTHYHAPARPVAAA